MLIHVFRALLFGFVIFCIGLGGVSFPVEAAVDPYVRQYLQVIDSVPIVMNDRGETRSFSVNEMIAGKKLFELHCASCHVGGSTLPNPEISLSLEKLKHATPPRDTVQQLVKFMRTPMTYDGSEESLLCREVPESWLSQAEVEDLSAFILRAAEQAKGWGTTNF